MPTGDLAMQICVDKFIDKWTRLCLSAVELNAIIGQHIRRQRGVKERQNAGMLVG